MAEIVRMPKMSDTMTEGVVSKWHKKVGDTVKPGDLIAEIETDKATMEFESYQEGVLLYIGLEEGKSAPVDGILAVLGKEGEDYSKLLEEEKGKGAADINGSKQEEKKEAAVGSGRKQEEKKEAAVSSGSRQEEKKSSPSPSVTPIVPKQS